MAKQSIYTVGGTVQAGGGVYIKRKADDELLEFCRDGEFAFILSSRQVGKSSLMVRTARQLEKENIRSAIIDLSAIGVKVSQDEWYLGILNEIQIGLDLQSDIFAWWEQYTRLGPAQRLTNFFRDVLLKEIPEQVVLFFDEIDSTLSIPFSDDFYVALRAVYNARSITPEFKRLSFVLAGVAAPGDLISDTKRTPFNIGQRVEVSDFTQAEALPLASGLGERAQQVLAWILRYTNGHPYLTQRLCAHLASSQDHLNEQSVEEAVGELFTGGRAKQADNNIQFVRGMLAERSPDVTKVLSTYKDIRAGKRVLDDERSIVKSHLKLSGLVRSHTGILQVRNEIYNRVFDLDWVKENMPKNWQKTAIIGLSITLAVLILGLLGVLINDYVVDSRINRSFRSFISAGDSSKQRLADLAQIYRQQGILSNEDTSLTASALFYDNLLTADAQLSLFPSNLSPSDHRALDDDLVVVTSHLYKTAANVDDRQDNTALLLAMWAAVGTVENNATASQLEGTLTAWLDGRSRYASTDYVAALDHYNAAITADPTNHAIRYERAKVYVALGDYENALVDLDAIMIAAKENLGNTPIPATASVSVTALQTSQPTQPSDPRTPLPVGGTRTPGPSADSIPTPGPRPDIPPQKFESNFTTLGEIVNAVQVIIQSNSELQNIVQTNSSAYTNLEQAGLTNFNPEAAADLRANILSRGYILVATDPSYEPQSFVNTEGQRPSDTRCPEDALTTAEMQGFDVDVASTLGNALDVETCFATPSWDEVITGSWQDQWDISIGSMTRTLSGDKVFDFSIPYYYISTVVAVRTRSGIDDLASLEGQAVCVGAGSLQERWLNHDLNGLDLPAASIHREAPNVTVVPLETDQECAQALEAGSADFVAYVASESAVDINISAGFPLTRLGPPVLSQTIVAAFDKDSGLSTTSLRTEVNQLFSAMSTDGRLSELSIKWYGLDLTKAPEVEIVQVSTPTLQPTSTPGPVSAQIPSDFPGTFIRVRQYPDLDATVVGSVQAGDQVSVTAYTINGWIWYQLDVPQRKIKGGWISGVIGIGGKNHQSVVSSIDIRSNTLFIPLEDITKP